MEKETIDDFIRFVDYHHFPETSMTVACITLHCGFSVIGYSSCVDPKEFSEQLGRMWAFQDARDKVSEFVAYNRSEEAYTKALSDNK